MQYATWVQNSIQTTLWLFTSLDNELQLQRARAEILECGLLLLAVGKVPGDVERPLIWTISFLDGKDIELGMRIAH